jgi:hypothetical protein
MSPKRTKSSTSQRNRVERLRATGYDTLDAEQTLCVFIGRSSDAPTFAGWDSALHCTAT